MTRDEGIWLSIDEAAKLSGYHPEYIRRLVRDGEIKGRKFSIVWQVDRESLSEYLKNAKSKDDKRYTPKRKR